jgi:hypothetical protein
MHAPMAKGWSAHNVLMYLCISSHMQLCVAISTNTGITVFMQVLRPGLVKGPWRSEEDAVIVRCLQEGITKWSEIAERIPGRIGKQCRERYFNHLDRMYLVPFLTF